MRYLLYYMSLLAIGCFLSLSVQAQEDEDDPDPCEALFSFVTDGYMVHFTDASVSNEGSEIVQWHWEFEDVGTSNQQNPMVTFPDADKYDVCLTVMAANGCVSDEYCSDVEICQLNMSGSIGECNADGKVPISVTITDPFDTAKDITVTIDGQSVPGSPFDIDDDFPVSLNFNIPGDGLQHNLTATSEDTEGCTNTITFSVPDCSADCFLSSIQVGLTVARYIT